MNSKFQIVVGGYVSIKANELENEYLKFQMDDYPALVLNISSDNIIIRTFTGQQFSVLLKYLEGALIWRPLIKHEKVFVTTSLPIMKKRQEGYGGWTNLMSILCGKKVEVIEVGPDNMIKIEYLNMQFIVNRKNLISVDLIKMLSGGIFVPEVSFIDEELMVNSPQFVFVSTQIDAIKIWDVNSSSLMKKIRSLLGFIENGDIENIKLADKETINSADIENDYIFPLLHAMNLDKPEIFELLIDQGASLTVQYNEGHNIMHYAAMLNKPRFIDLILKHSKKSILFSTNWKNQTPFIVAASKGSLEVCKMFLEDRYCKLQNQDGLTLIECADAVGNAALHAAVINNEIEIAQMIVEINIGLARMENKEQISPFLMAIVRHKYNIAHSMVQFDNSIVNSERSKNGVNCILLALMSKIEISDLKFILTNWKELDINKSDSNGTTPLHLAVGHDSEYVELLIQHGADVNIQDKSGNTPLHKVVKAAKLHNEKVVEDIVRILVEHKANIEMINHNNETPMDMAVAQDINFYKFICPESKMPFIHLSTKKENNDNGKLEDLRNKLKEYQETDACKICASNSANVLFDCGHLVCNSCSLKLIECPFCRQNIKHRIKLLR